MVVFKDILEPHASEDLYMSEEYLKKLIIFKTPREPKFNCIGYFEHGTGIHQANRVFMPTALCPTVCASQHRLPTFILVEPMDGKGIVNYMGKDYSIRRMSSKEAWRLQGLSDVDHDKAEPLLPPAPLYERAGRCICVPLLESLFSKYLDFESYPNLKVFEAFAGIGSQRMALKNLGVSFEHVGISEVDRWGLLAYDSIHNDQSIDFTIGKTCEEMVEEMRSINIAYSFTTDKDEMPEDEKDIKLLYNATKRSNNFGDISKIDENTLPDIDFFTYSFPCHDISVAGVQKGFDKDSKTHSGLLWECERIISCKKPKYLMLENVDAISNTKNLDNFLRWIDILDDMGYDTYWDMYNAKDFGVPQNRNRVIAISVLRDDITRTSPRRIMEKNSLW